MNLSPTNGALAAAVQRGGRFSITFKLQDKAGHCIMSPASQRDTAESLPRPATNLGPRFRIEYSRLSSQRTA